MLKAGDLARREDHRVRGGQNRENPTRSGDITCMWVHVRTASLRRFYHVPAIFVLSKNKKKYIFLMKIAIFEALKITVYSMGVLS